MHILNHITDEIIFASAEAKTMIELIKEAQRAGVSLVRADLRGADLSWSDLRGFDLRETNLCRTNLRETDLRGADLRLSDLQGADLYKTNLLGTDIRGALLYGANLCGSRPEIEGLEVIQINGMAYPIIINDTGVQVGCQTHTFADWRNISKEELVRLDGRKALKFYPVLLHLMDSLCGDRESGAHPYRTLIK